MSQEVLLRGLFFGIATLIVMWVVFSRHDEESGTEVLETKRQRYLPYIYPILPLFLLSLVVLVAFIDGMHDAILLALSFCFSTFLHISLYYLILLPVLPLLRRIISARACALLWMIPNCLYLFQRSDMKLPSPLLVITAKGNLAWILLWVWIAGFAAVLIWKIAEHLSFRRMILRDAKPVTDWEILATWRRILRDGNFRKPKYKLVISSGVATPLTIGLFKRTTTVVLPEKTYAKEDMELILRHELVHIGREDAWCKFFIIFCTAMCWFNPLIWVAMRKSAEDVELSCDETVLLDSNEAERKRYALLLLDAAGDERGFTTCLSASAKALRYRLQSVTRKEKRLSGALIVGVVFFILCMTSGYVALAYDGESGAQRIYQSADFSEYKIREVKKVEDEFHTDYEIRDESAFHEYLGGLTVYELTGHYTFSDSNRHFGYTMVTPTGMQFLSLYDHAVRVARVHNGEVSEVCYYIPDGINWDYIDSVIVAHPALNVHLKEADSEFGRDLTTAVNYLWKTENEVKTLLREADTPYDPYFGIFGYEPNEATFVFSQELAAPFSVRVESWDRSITYTVSQSEMRDGFTMDLPDYPAHYTVYASFYDADGALYEAEFWFNIGKI